MIHHGDLFDVLPTLEAESIDACVTDPPYGIGFMGKQWDTFKQGAEAKRIVPNKQIASDNPNLRGRTRGPASSPSAVEYDYSAKGLQAFEDWTARWAREVFRVLKPGAHIVVCGAPRAYHRMACGIEDAGFEIRDCFAWLFGSGFPKSLNLGEGLGTALKPAHEPIVLARKPFKGSVRSNVERYGTGALNIDACRIATDESWSYDADRNGTTFHGEQGARLRQTAEKKGAATVDSNPLGRWPANVVLDETEDRVMYLMYNIPVDAARVIREYFDGYNVLSAVPQIFRDVCDQAQTRQGEVLREAVLLEVAERQSARRCTSDEGEEASAKLDRKDAPDQGRDGSARIGQSEMEGRSPCVARLHHGGVVSALGEGASAIRIDGECEFQQLYPGTSIDSRSETREAIASEGDRPPSEREQAGQPDLESGITRSGAAHQRASTRPAGIEASARRERAIEIRTLEVLECHIPRVWLAYFGDTGKVVRGGAALVLDEMSGELTSGAKPAGIYDLSGRRGGMMGDVVPRVQSVDYGSDVGGASRFFYCAKPSREERDMGCYDLPARTAGQATDREDGTAGLNNPRAGAGRTGGARNIHPTVKPVELMRWLVRLVTPVGGTVLDPFTGSGTTGMACRYELREFIGIEREAEYVAIAERRIAAVAPLFAADVPVTKPIEPSLALGDLFQEGK